MGCADSQLKVQDFNQQQAQKGKAIRFAPGVDDDTVLEPDQSVGKIKKQKSKSRSKSKGKKNDGDAETPSKEEKENTVKVKKARNLRHHPQHEKFIENIMQQSRTKVSTEFPQIPRTMSGFVKPVIEYTPTPKGQILPNQGKLNQRSRWNIPISEGQRPRENHLEFNQSYVSINQAVKSPYKQKEIEKRLNDIRNGRFEQSQSGQLSCHRPALFEEMECTYLQ